MTPKRIVSLALGLLAVFIGAGFAARTQEPTSRNGSTPATRSGKSQAESIDPSGCGGCHKAEVAGFALSAMSHSIRAGGEEPIGKVAVPGTTITISSSPAGTWQRLQAGGDTSEYHVDYALGSGKHATGYLVAIHNHLFQSPVAYYRSRYDYDLAPGYEDRPSPDFSRPVTPSCLFCHSGNAEPVAGTTNEYQSPPFLHLAIGCSRCHGDTAAHLAHPGPSTIVNPALLQGAARDSICEQCHLLGVARVLNPGKQLSDFRPGTPLESTFTIYRNNMLPGTTAPFKVISHVEQLALSKCVREGGGRLWCGTCHDPHRDPVQPAEFYRAKCLSCHTTGLRNPHPAKDSNCIGCHMPKRDAKDGGHTAFTDHRIQRQPEPEQPATEDTDIAAWREPADDDLRKRNLGIAYVQVGIARQSAAFVERGYALLAEVQDSFSTDPGLYRWIGAALLPGKQYSEAQRAYAIAFQLDPASSTVQADLGQAYALAGDSQTASHYLEDALQKDPLNLSVANLLMDIYGKQGATTKAADLSKKMSAAMK